MYEIKIYIYITVNITKLFFNIQCNIYRPGSCFESFFESFFEANQNLVLVMLLRIPCWIGLSSIFHGEGKWVGCSCTVTTIKQSK